MCVNIADVSTASQRDSAPPQPKRTKNELAAEQRKREGMHRSKMKALLDSLQAALGAEETNRRVFKIVNEPDINAITNWLGSGSKLPPPDPAYICSFVSIPGEYKPYTLKRTEGRKIHKDGKLAASTFCIGIHYVHVRQGPICSGAYV